MADLLCPDCSPLCGLSSSQPGLALDGILPHPLCNLSDLPKLGTARSHSSTKDSSPPYFLPKNELTFSDLLESLYVTHERKVTGDTLNPKPCNTQLHTDCCEVVRHTCLTPLLHYYSHIRFLCVTCVYFDSDNKDD
jgi:hypothetical protein